MSAGDRIAMFPSRANLVLMKQRIVAATRGLNLLKRKRDALELKLRELRAELKKHAQIISSVMQEAFLSMSRGTYLGTDFKPASVMSADRADAFMRIKNNKVAGLQLPTFDLILRNSTCFPLTGLSRGGQQVEVIRQKFQDALRTLIALASLEYSVRVLEEGVRHNNMRINGLDYVVIPRFTNTVNYIRDELEEYEREDFYRLKRSQAKQRAARSKFSMMIKMKTLSPEDLDMLTQGGVTIPETGKIDEHFKVFEFEEKVRRTTLMVRKETEFAVAPLLPPPKRDNVDIATQTSELLENISLFDLPELAESNGRSNRRTADGKERKNLQTQTSGSFE